MLNIKYLMLASSIKSNIKCRCPAHNTDGYDNNATKCSVYSKIRARKNARNITIIPKIVQGMMVGRALLVLTFIVYKIGFFCVVQSSSAIFTRVLHKQRDFVLLCQSICRSIVERSQYPQPKKTSQISTSFAKFTSGLLCAKPQNWSKSGKFFNQKYAYLRCKMQGIVTNMQQTAMPTPNYT